MDAVTPVALPIATFLVGLVLGAVAVVLRALSPAHTQVAALTAERDLLRERVAELAGAGERDRGVVAALAPLADSLGRVEGQVRSLERDRVEQYARLAEQLTAVRAGSDALREQTATLAGALRSPSARGAWGEVQLRRVVEHAGMLARVDFTEQMHAVRSDASGSSGRSVGTAVRPDLVVHLPGGKNVVVDAKTPLSAFLAASEADQDEAGHQRRATLLAAHARAVRGHVDTLAAKEYWAAFQPAPELVVCFVPGEAFLAAACQSDPTLLEYAMTRRVVLATPTTLLTLLRTVAVTWQQDALTGSARELLGLGRELYTRLGGLGGHTQRLGRALHRAVEDYNSMVGTLERRVLVTARKIRDLDITDAELPELPVVEATCRPLAAPELLAVPRSEPGALERAG